MKRLISHMLEERHRAPVTVFPETTVLEAAKMMAAEKIGAVMVVDSINPKFLVGILSERDVLYRVTAQNASAETTAVDAVMTKKPQTIGPDELGMVGLRMMEDAGFRHLPVVENNCLIGVISHRDFTSADWEKLGAERGLWENIA